MRLMGMQINGFLKLIMVMQTLTFSDLQKTHKVSSNFLKYMNDSSLWTHGWWEVDVKARIRT